MAEQNNPALTPSGKKRGNVGVGSCGTSSGGTPGGGGCSCGNGGTGGSKTLGPNSSVMDFIAAGTPQLALAKAMGVPFVPWYETIKAEFTSASAGAPLPDIASKQQITRHTIVDGIAWRVLNESTANSSTLQPQADWYNNFQLGIECTMKVLGRPGYIVVDDFTDLSLLSDTQGNGMFPRGWILSYEQAISMSFNSRIALPVVPMLVTVVFRTWNPVSDYFDFLNPRDAIQQLWNDFGVDVGEMWTTCICGGGSTGSGSG